MNQKDAKENSNIVFHFNFNFNDPFTSVIFKTSTILQALTQDTIRQNQVNYFVTRIATNKST